MFGHRLAVHEHVALVGVEQADHVLDADRLAGARRAEDHRDLALGDAHVQAAQDLVAAERLVDVDELDRVGAPVGRFRPVCQWYSSSSARCGSLTTDARSVCAVGAALVARRGVSVLARGAAPRACSSAVRRSSSMHAQPPIGARGLAPQKSCVPSIPMRCTSTMFSTIDFAVAVPTPDRAAAGVVAVVAADEHDRRSPSTMPLITLYKRSGGFWNIQKIRKKPPRGDLADLLHHRQVAGEEAGADRRRCT